MSVALFYSYSIAVTFGMISHTKAFKAYRDLSQGHLNFVVLSCHSVPALKTDLQADPNAVPGPPDHFKGVGTTASALLGYISEYQKELARSTLITVFSYFEAYLKDALQEVVDFHGGNASLKKITRERSERFFQTIPAAMQASKLKLQDEPSPNKADKYRKHAQILEKAGFRFPTDLLAHFGAVQLIAKIDEKRGFKAHEIPTILEEALLFPLTEPDRTEFERVRSARNRIAHGKAAALTLPTSLRHASALRKLAAAVDAHITKHFLIIQSI